MNAQLERAPDPDEDRARRLAIEAEAATHQQIGTIVRFNGMRGFGFVRPDGRRDRDVFVHVSAFVESERASLRDGCRIAFDVASSEKGPMAIDARIL